MVPAALHGYAPPLANGELHIERFGEMEIRNAADATVSVHQVLEHMPLGNGVAVGLGEKADSDTRAQPQDEMRQADKGYIEVEVRRDGVPKERVLPEAPVTEPHPHAGLAVANRTTSTVSARTERDRPFVQRLPLRVECNREVRTKTRTRPSAFVAHHHIHLSIGHDSTRTEHGAAVHKEFRLHAKRRQQADEGEPYETTVLHSGHKVSQILRDMQTFCRKICVFGKKAVPLSPEWTTRKIPDASRDFY